MTKKQLIVEYVAKQGNDGARYTDIQRFIYEHNHGPNTFDPVENRGYYSCAFSQICRWTKGKSRYKNYLMHGDGLVKVDGRYYAKRQYTHSQVIRRKELKYGDIATHLLDWVFENGPVSYSSIEDEYKRYTHGSNSFSHHLPNLRNVFTMRLCSRFITKDTKAGLRGLYTLDSNYGMTDTDKHNYVMEQIGTEKLAKAAEELYWTSATENLT